MLVSEDDKENAPEAGKRGLSLPRDSASRRQFCLFLDYSQRPGGKERSPSEILEFAGP